jgi:sodium-dependent phosphate cotransporter
MGANIGTSVTNTLVSLSHYGDKETFRRGFAAATVHDCFNILTVIVLLPVQWATEMFDHMTWSIARHIDACETECEKQEFIQPYLKPYYDDIAKYDKKIANNVAQGFCDGKCNDKANVTVRRAFMDLLNCTDCVRDSWLENGVIKAERLPGYLSNFSDFVYECSCENAPYFLETTDEPILKTCLDLDTTLCDGSLLIAGIFHRDWHMTDSAAGVTCLMFSLSGIFAVLLLLVHVLNHLLVGPVAKRVQQIVSLNGYLSILIGAFVTIMVQSSSITTSVLTPLVAIDTLSLEDMYPLTLGANMGTTVTGILAASVVTSNPIAAWQVALTHLFFNLFGILMWYPFKQTREIPIRMANYLGDKTVEYAWFPFAYTTTTFFIIPGAVYGISVLAN